MRSPLPPVDELELDELLELEELLDDELESQLLAKSQASSQCAPVPGA